MKPKGVMTIGALALLVGCSSGAGATNPDGGGGPTGTLFGNVVVQLFDDPDPAAAYSTVQAGFLDGATPLANPALGPLAVSQRQGDCELLVPKVVTCASPCTGVCTDDNRCTPNPAPKTAGTITVEGLAGMSIALQPMGPNFVYSGGPTLPFPPCAEGGTVKAQASAFTLTGACIAPLKLTGATPIPVVSGQPVVIAWTPPGRAGISRVLVALEIAHHGGYKGEIDCDVPDTGSLSIPAPLVTALINLGLAGYPTVQVTRVGAVAASGEPGVKLLMHSFSEREVDTGVISCMDTETCPAGKTCQGNFTCQ